MTTLRQAVIHHNRRRRKTADEVNNFDLASPADLGSAGAGGSLSTFKLLGSVNVGIIHSADTNEGDITIDLSNGRQLVLPGAVGDVTQKLDYLEKGLELTINRAGAPAGDVDLVVFGDWHDVQYVVANGVFT